MVAKTNELMNLARSRAPGDRERLLLAIVDLCDAGDDAAGLMASGPIQALLNSIFMSLVVEAERDIRRRLAEKLAHAEWAPAALINILALDDIEIARPVIAASPVLQDHDLVRLLVEATIEHQIEVARRPKIGQPVVAAILAQGDPAVLGALAANETAAVGREELCALIDASERIAGLRAPLARHPKLDEDLALRLYAWVGQVLRLTLTDRFRLDPAALDEALESAVREAYAGAPPQKHRPDRGAEREEMERRLIAKLYAAGQLRPGYLLRALKEGRLTLFVTALAALGRFDAGHVRRAVNSERPELLALACAAVGIDRGAFPTILGLVRDLNQGRPGGGQEGARRASGAFGPFDAEIAGAAFRHAVNTG